MQVLWFGVGLGVMLLITKMCSFYLLTHKKVEVINPTTGKPEKFRNGQVKTEMIQRQVKRWLFFGEKQGVYTRIHESTFLLFLVDCFGGWIGGHALAIGGASMLAMVALASYMIMCMSMLMSQFFMQWFWRKVEGLITAFVPSKTPHYSYPPRRRYSYA